MPYSGSVPGRNAGRILPGPYRVENIDIALEAHLTSTASVGIYRGAGRPEACMLMERLMDRAAAVIGVDPIDLRRRNVITPDAFPYRTPTGETLDSGDYPLLLKKSRGAGRLSGPLSRAHTAAQTQRGRRHRLLSLHRAMRPRLGKRPHWPGA